MWFGWRFQLGFRPAALLFGGAGLLLLALGVRDGLNRRERLAHWPRADAHVDSADVVGMDDRAGRQDLYAPRLWLAFEWRGWPVARAVTREVYSSNYGAAVKAARQAVAREHLTILVNPNDDSDLSFDAGANFTYFFGAILFGGLGLFFCAFGLTFFAVARSDQRKAERKAAGIPEPKGRSVPAWVVTLVVVVFGGMFVAGGLIGAVATYRQRHWPTVAAHVDSTDVVWSTSGTGRDRTTMYAARYWLSYPRHDSTYRLPVIPGAWFSGRGVSERRAAAGRARGVQLVDVDPGDPYHAIPHASVVGAYWIPALFAGIGLGVWVVALIVVFHTRRRRSARRAHHSSRPRPEPNGALHPEEA